MTQTQINLEGTPFDQLRAMILGPAANGKLITGDEVDFHDSPKISLPKGMTYGRAYDVLSRLEKDAEKITAFSRVFRFRPDDGAHAAFQVVKSMFGMSFGVTIESFFGDTPPELKTIAIGVNETMQVPWGLISIPTLPGLELYISQTRDRDYGVISQIHGEGPKKYREIVEAFFDNIQDFLENHSIYRGRAIIGADDPEFLDLSSFDPSKIVFSEDVMKILDGTVWAPIRHTAAMRREGVSLKRAALLHGPYGTGKTSTGQLTAKVAVDNGWTFISARAGRDKPEDVLRTARLYQPAVVFIEDIDTSSSSGEDDDVTKLLDAFDGITAKGGELMVLMTTNHLERIHKGMLRPGRLDAVVEIAGLDRVGIEKLIQAVIPEDKLANDVDYDRVAAAMEGFLPAFVRESLTRAVTFAIARTDGGEYVIDTPDLEYAAKSLLPQLAALNDAGTGVRRPTFDTVMDSAVKTAVKGLRIFEPGRAANLAILDKDEEYEPSKG